MRNNDLIEALKNSEVEHITRFQPVNNKYLRWNQIKKFIIPMYLDFTGMTIEEAQKKVLRIIEKNELLRATVDRNNVVYIKKMPKAIIRVYATSDEEFNNICYKMAEKLLNQELYHNVLYDCCFHQQNDKITFFGLFNHIITDGQSKNLLNAINKNYKSNYFDFIEYLNRLNGEERVSFNTYVNFKKELVDKYLYEEMEYFKFTLKDNTMMIKKGYSLEEFWAVVICSYIKNHIENLKSVPLNITSGGNSYNGKIIESFGDFHEDFIFVIEDFSKFIEDFRYYKEIKYLNAEQYDSYLHKNPMYCEFIEPITLSVKWQSNEYNEFQIVRKKLPPHAKQAILGFNILVNSNLKEAHIDIRVSKKLSSIFLNFQEDIYEYIRASREG